MEHVGFSRIRQTLLTQLRRGGEVFASVESLEWGANKFRIEQGVHYGNSSDSPHKTGGCREKRLASSRT